VVQAGRKLRDTQSQKLVTAWRERGSDHRAALAAAPLRWDNGAGWGRRQPWRGTSCDDPTESRGRARSRGQERSHPGKQQSGEEHAGAWGGSPHSTEPRYSLRAARIRAGRRQAATGT